MDERKRELDKALDELYRVVEDKVDIGRRIADRPYAWVLGSFLLGAVIGCLRRPIMIREKKR